MNQSKEFFTVTEFFWLIRRLSLALIEVHCTPDTVIVGDFVL